MATQDQNSILNTANSLSCALDLKCSCSHCDSLYCFENRNKNPEEKCNCLRCKNTKSCLYYKEVVTDLLNNLIESADIDRAVRVPQVKVDINVGLEKQMGIVIKDLKCKIDNQQISNDEAKTLHSEGEQMKTGSDKPNVSPIKKKTFEEQIVTKDTVYATDSFIEISKILSQKQSKLSYTDNFSSKENVYNDHRKTTCDNGYFFEVPLDYNISKYYPKEEINSDAAKLSAQIMNVPYTKSYHSYNQLQLQAEPNKEHKLSLLDIYKRIKDAYKACSCKFCECIGSKIHYTSNKCDKCSYKTCKCSEGSAYSPKPQFSKSFYSANVPSCNCKPCECIDCIVNSIKSCDCKICQCIECRSMAMQYTGAIVVGAVSEDRSPCDCNQCACANCPNPYSSNRARQEMSTEMDRHPSCRCEMCNNEACVPDERDICDCVSRKTVMKKPVANNLRDFDIRRVSVGNKRNIEKSRLTYETMAMYEILINKYPKLTVNNCGQNQTNSYEISKFKDYKSLEMRKPTLIERETTIYSSNNVCNCSPCECQICSKIKETFISKTHKLKNRIDKRCMCNTICDCLHCDAMTTIESRNIQSNKTTNICKCELCECIDCQNIVSKLENVKHPINCSCENCMRASESAIKKAKLKLVNPVYFQKSFRQKQLTKNYKLDLQKEEKTCSSKETSVYHVSSFENTENSADECTSSNMTNTDETHKLKRILKCNKIKSDFYSDDDSCSRSDAFTETYFDTDSSSCHKKSELILQSFSKKGKPQPSLSSEYYESSSQDSHPHRTLFPRTTVLNCLNDVLTLDVGLKSLNLDRFKVSTHIINEEDPHVTFRACEDKDYYKNSYNEELSNYTAASKNLKIKRRYYNEQLETIPKKSQTYVETDKEKIYDAGNDTKTSLDNIHDQREDDIKKAQKTLGRAREFSSELMKILLKYKKANEEFKSVTKVIRQNEPVNDVKLTNNDILVAKSEKHIAVNTYIPSTKENNTEPALDLMTNTMQVMTNDPFFSNDGENDSSPKNCLKKRISVDIKISDFNVKKNENTSIMNHNAENLNSYKEYRKLIRRAALNIRREKLKHRLLTNSALVEGLRKTCSHNTSREESKIPPTLITETKLVRNPHYDAEVINVEEMKIILDLIKEISKFKESPTQETQCPVYENYPTEEISNYPIIKVEMPKIEKKQSKESSTRETQFQVYENYKMEENFNQPVVKVEMPKIEEKQTKQSSTQKTQCQVYENYPMEENFNQPILNVEMPKIEKKQSKESPTRETQCQVYENYKMEENFNKPILKVEMPKIEKKQSKESPTRETQCQVYENYPMNEIFNRPTLKVEMPKIETKRTLSLLKKNYMDKESKLNPQKIKPVIIPQSERKKTAQESINLLSDEGFRAQHENKSKVNLEVKNAPSQADLWDNHMGVETTQEAYSTCKMKPHSKDLYSVPTLQEIKKLYNVEMNLKHDIDKEMTSMESSKSNCEAYKVGFHDLRRVSDHTVMVKWNPPEDVSEVQGYEILVDGRAVQKMLSPMRRMAVVTCLPHCDKVLLTIRTITKTFGKHYPATTIVYRPRLK